MSTVLLLDTKSLFKIISKKNLNRLLVDIMGQGNYNSRQEGLWFK